jgi:hypothetical protein
MTLEQIDAAFPNLMPGLIDHPGISLALVTSAQYGPLAIGKNGIRYLRDGRVEEEDPTLQFGPNAPRHLLREAEFANVPDIVVISSTDPETGEVPAFEELVGNHGGLGGWQREPFVLYPAEFDPGPDEIVGAGHLHDLLKRWMAESRGVEESRSRGDETASRRVGKTARRRDGKATPPAAASSSNGRAHEAIVRDGE